MRRFLSFLEYAVLGGTAVWVPDILLHAIRSHSYSGRDLVMQTILLPLAAIVAFAVFLRIRRAEASPPFIALSMLLGTWVLGPFCIGVGINFAGGTLFKGEGIKYYVVSVLAFPTSLLI